MTVLERRRGNPFADMLSWLDDADRGFGLMSQVRVEDFVDEGTYVLRADIPGVDPDKDLDVRVQDGHLVVRGERKEEEREKYRHEVRYGSFSRSVTLPAGAHVDEISARYQDGVLEVRVPLGEPATEGRQVPVERPED